MGYRPQPVSGKASIAGVNSVLNFPSGASCGSSAALITPWGGRRDELGHKPARALCAGVFLVGGDKKEFRTPPRRRSEVSSGEIASRQKERNELNDHFTFGSGVESKAFSRDNARTHSVNAYGRRVEQEATADCWNSAQPAISFGPGAVEPQRKQTQFANRPSCEVSGCSWSDSLS